MLDIKKYIFFSVEDSVESVEKDYKNAKKIPIFLQRKKIVDKLLKKILSQDFHHLTNDD